MSEHPDPPSPSLIRDRDFLKLWTAQTVSVLGTQVTILAVPILAALALRVSPLEFGLLATLEYLPTLILGLPAGVWVDRLRRRPILIAGDLLRAIALLSIPIAFVLDVLTIWQLYAVVFVNGCLTVFFDVAWQSYLPSLVARDRLVDGNAKLELTRVSSQRLGPGIAGVLIALLTAPFAILLDALSYLVSAVAILAIRRPEPPPAPRAAAGEPRPTMRNDIGAGIRYVTRQPTLRALALSVALSNLFACIADSILILYLVTERQFTAVSIGAAFSIGAVGVIAGALVTSRLTRVLGVGPMIVLAALGESLSWLPVAIAPDELLFAGLTATIVALGFFGIAWNVNATSLRQAITPRPMQGRMNATMRFVAGGAVPVGFLAGGALGGLIGLHETIWVGALGCLLGSLPVALTSVRHVRELPATDGEPGPAIA